MRLLIKRLWCRIVGHWWGEPFARTVRVTTREGNQYNVPDLLYVSQNDWVRI